MEAAGINTADIRIIASVFYADDGSVAIWDPKTLQDAFNLIYLFAWVGLVTSTSKTEVMVFLLGMIRMGRCEGVQEGEAGRMARVPEGVCGGIPG